MSTKRIIFSLTIASIICIITSFLIFRVNPFSAHNEEIGFLNLSDYDSNDNSLLSLGDMFVSTDSDDPDFSHCYQLTVNLPKDSEYFVLRIPASIKPTAFTINGHDIYTNLGNDKSKVYYRTPKIISYDTNSADILVIKAYVDCYDYETNLPYINPIKYYDFYTGSIDAIYKYQSSNILLNIGALILFLIAAGFHLNAYIYRRHQTIYIYLSLTCFSVVSSILVSQQNILCGIFQHIPTYLSTRIYLYSILIRIVCLMLITKYFYEKLIIKQIYKTVRATLIVLSILCLFIPVDYFFILVVFINVLNIICIIFTLRVSIVALIKFRDKNTMLMIVGFLSLLSGTFIETTYHLALSWAYQYPPVTYILFIVAYTLLAANQYYESMTNINKIAPKLKHLVYELQGNKSTYITTHIDPEYLYKTLESIYNNIDSNQEKVDMLIQSLSKYLRQTLDFNAGQNTHSVSAELAFCHAYIDLVNTMAPGIRFNFNIEDNYPDIEIPQFSIQILIENSVRHAFKGVLKPTVDISVKKNFKRLEITVSDNGIGMSPDEINLVTAYPLSQANIGLYHINQSLLDMGGLPISIKSTINRYTTVRIILPIVERSSSNE